jgi:8-oxo-dGTP diphosphatase
MKNITVVSALFLNDKMEMLMALRHPTQIPPNRWENPGGKVEEGETERDALVREMREELGVEVGVGRLVSTASYTWDARLHMLLYLCWIKSGEPKPLESQELRWVNPVHARKQLACLPATYSWYPDIMNAVDDHAWNLKQQA